jgi:hypothetical protein
MSQQEQRTDWEYIISTPWTSRIEDKRRGPNSIWVPIGALIFIAFLGAGIVLIHSGDENLGAGVILLGLVVVIGLLIRVNRSMGEATGQVSGWSFDPRTFLEGAAMLALGLFLMIDPLHVFPENIFGYGNLIGVLGFAVAMFGLVICVMSLRD